MFNDAGRQKSRFFEPCLGRPYGNDRLWGLAIATARALCHRKKIHFKCPGKLLWRYRSSIVTRRLGLTVR